MPCIRCDGTGVNDSFYDRTDEQGNCGWKVAEKLYGMPELPGLYVSDNRSAQRRMFPTT